MKKLLWFIVGILALTTGCAQEPQDPLAMATALADAASGPTIVTVFGEIDQALAIKTSGQIISAEAGAGKSPILVFIDSPGGDIDAGNTIVSAMLLCINHPVYTIDIGEADSMAAIIFTYGQKRVMWPRSSLLFHNAHASGEGTLPQIISRSRHYLGIVTKYEQHIADLAKISYKEYRERANDEWWLDQDEALASHIATSVGNVPLQ